MELKAIERVINDYCNQHNADPESLKPLQEILNIASEHIQWLIDNPAE